MTIPGTSLDRVKKALVAEMSKRKFHVVRESGQTISFEQPASKAALESLSSRAVRGGNPVELRCQASEVIVHAGAPAAARLARASA